MMLMSRQRVQLQQRPNRASSIRASTEPLRAAITKPKARTRPGNSVELALRNFSAESGGILLDIKRALGLSKEEASAPDCFGFTLSNEAIWEFEKQNAPPTGREETPKVIQVLYDILLFFVDRLYTGRAIERFWFLETVARMPYFSYVTCLHLYETLGWWRTAELRKIHFAEEWNELHHLMIMESLGGDVRWRDRFLALHAAVFYYWALVVCYLISPKYSYKFSEMLETHAVSTYRQFLLENEAKLRKLPAPAIAVRYYKTGDLYLFDVDSELVRGATGQDVRRPPVDTLYDVFRNILEDEWEHVKTMVLCQEYDSLEALVGNEDGLGPVDAPPPPEVRARWKAWAGTLEAQEAHFFDFEDKHGNRDDNGKEGAGTPRAVAAAETAADGVAATLPPVEE